MCACCRADVFYVRVPIVAAGFIMPLERIGDIFKQGANTALREWTHQCVVDSPQISRALPAVRACHRIGLGGRFVEDKHRAAQLLR